MTIPLQDPMWAVSGKWRGVRRTESSSDFPTIRAVADVAPSMRAKKVVVVYLDFHGWKELAIRPFRRFLH